MKKSIVVILAGLIISFLNGCFYESPVPIDNPTVKLNSVLLGSWKVNDPNGSEGSGSANDIYTLTAKNEYLYSIEIKHLDKNTVEKLEGYVSLVKGVMFLNVYDKIPSNSPIGYNFFKIEIINISSIKLFPITENIREEFKSSKELKEFIANNMMNSYFFDKPYRCSKTAPKH